MKSFNVTFAFVLLFCALAKSLKSNANDELTALPNYAEPEMWFSQVKDSTKEVDVFYVVPTCVWDWTTSKGEIMHYMDTQNPKQRAAVEGSNRLAAALFGKSCRFYAPYYRQITMNSWMLPPAEIKPRYAVAYQDVVKAFKYYMKAFNNGRPFLLAGHSQGAKTVIELLKHVLTHEQRQKLVAAYAFGFEVRKKELIDFPQIKLAKDSLDCGVLICYNSVSTPAAISPLLKENVACINPLNWRTDATPATANENLGSVFFHKDGVSDTLYHKVSAQIDTTAHVLLIKGVSDDAYAIPSIQTLFPKGNYHVQELNLYFLNLQKNIKQRIESFQSKQKGRKAERSKEN
ncbi:MAG: DUF3089 domain-containing protein [Bacteroidaceae bacterium]